MEIRKIQHPIRVEIIMATMVHIVTVIVVGVAAIKGTVLILINLSPLNLNLQTGVCLQELLMAVQSFHVLIFLACLLLLLTIFLQVTIRLKES